MAGSWDSTRALQVASKSGRIAPSALHSCSTNSTMLLLGGVAGQELVNVRHQVDADGACKGVS